MGPVEDGAPDIFPKALQRLFGNQTVIRLSYVAVSLAFLLLSFKEVKKGQVFRNQTSVLEQRLKAEEDILLPLISSPDEELRDSREPTQSAPDVDRDEPIKQWLSGVGGAEQALAAQEDLRPAQAPLVRLPQRPDPGLSDREVWKAVDFEAEDSRWKENATAEAKAIEQEAAPLSMQPHSVQRSLDVKRLMTSTSFAKWSRCVDHFQQAKLTAGIMQTIENGDLKAAPQAVASALTPLQHLKCVFFTKGCVSPNADEILKSKHKKRFTASEISKLPRQMDRGSLGSCAIVGHSDRLLMQQRGVEIDAHTTVIRTGFYHGNDHKPSAPPLEGFEMHTGRRTDFVFLQADRSYPSERLPLNQHVKAWQTPDWQVLHSPGNKVEHVAGKGDQAAVIRRAAAGLYSAFRGTKLAPKSDKTSAELVAVLWWLASGACKTIDVYGMPFPQPKSPHSKAYWSTAAYDLAGSEPWPGPLIPARNAYLEMYALHIAMRQGLLCVRTL
uniref:Uncharacterized protein n=1 Tax=Tetraselmis sp. GSL018 TaxID=582737 RepID=A0A061RB91_9CHLO|mmetsp:Transcript_16017/g.37971  ORF Transcript_16017/g.37971 Transcript_16017/m.37971 type:complete len:498 (-) Transcript_16017:166-1659(-)|eukprot:CAMPEP_0177585732 /NCGR_PEP_ID=MMETSP0419_2-20121207/4666_1 /TAXON_ID=582737 /ORGANISM="Tetraselmis sp., Strain GSL018" /LENGTH=497 /DNA_ID=CAMNT_0019075517 /DNA_START=188 /DNA_END=1681 /DNA_ORIENTATION=+